MNTLQNLVNDFPEFFQDTWDISIEHGWIPIIRRVCENIKEEIKRNPSASNFSFAQIKEKFGRLRIYCNNLTDEIQSIVEKGMAESYHTCEYCGSTQNVSNDADGGSWIKTLCSSCHEKRKSAG